MKHNLLLLQKIDELDISKLAKVSLEFILCECLKVLDVPNVYVSCCTGVDSECQGRRQRARVLPPAYFETTVVHREPLVRSYLEERERRGWVDERHELGKEKRG